MSAFRRETGGSPLRWALWNSPPLTVVNGYGTPRELCVNRLSNLAFGKVMGHDETMSYGRVTTILAGLVAIAFTLGFTEVVPASLAVAQTNGGTIAGDVTAAINGTAVSGVCVSAESTSSPGTAGGIGVTSSSGHYSITDLPSGTYSVFFSADGRVTCTGGLTQNYIDQCYDDQQTCSSSNPVSVTAGTKTASINAALEQGGRITGTVSAQGGSTLGGICVIAQEAGGSDDAFGQAATTSNGTYSLLGLPTGSYDVVFVPAGYTDGTPVCSGGVSQNYVRQWYSTESSLASANPVAVTAGIKTGSIDAVLQRGGKFEGTVTSDADGSDLSGICVSASDSDQGAGGSAVTSSNGHYSIIGLPTGSYNLQYTGCGQNYISQAFSLSATAGRKSRANVTMEPGGEISGTVTDANGGPPLSRVCVDAEAVGEGGTGFAATEADGTYTVVALPSGNYTVRFYDCGSAQYAPQYFNGQPTYATANLVSVTAGAETESINAAMQPGGSISGTVTAATGGGDLGGICVDAFYSGYEVGVVTASDGTYSINELPAGTYDVEFQGGCGNSGSYVTQWYNDEPTQSTADPATVNVGATTGSIDAAMQQ
jgi:hypothetical protein